MPSIANESPPPVNDARMGEESTDYKQCCGLDNRAPIAVYAARRSGNVMDR
jgi:hypothetical protein